MNSMKFFTLLIILTTTAVNGKQSPDEWFGQKWLDENYLFKWKTNHLEKVITIRVEVMTKGWVGFGFTKHGKTTETDVVIGWVDDWGHSTFNDYWVNNLGNRSLDVSQDWTLLSGEENATHTILEYSRHLLTCDDKNDLEIFENDFEVSNIIYSFSFLDPININTIGEPIVEQIIHLNLFAKPEILPKETDIEIVDHWLNITMDPNSNGIYCMLFKKDFIAEQQYATIIDPPEIWNLNHHFLLLNCIELSDVDEHLGKTFPCYDMKNNFIRQKCSLVQLELILSNEPVVFPDNVGLSLDFAQSSYFLIECHLINPSVKTIDASLSFRIWLTKQFRKHQLSYLAFSGTTGSGFDNWGYIVPPKQAIFKVSMVTSGYCFGIEKFAENGIHIFKAFFHSHQALSAELRHYRHDKLIRVIKQTNNDPGWQPFRSLTVPINFRNGDKMVGFCDYNSVSENKSYTSPKEHCAVLTYYYPAIPTRDEKVSMSRIPYELMLNITGLQQIDGYKTEIQENILIRKPVKYNNTKLIDFISENKYKINDPKELEELQISSDMMECCYIVNYDHAKNKPCRLFKKPPGLYQSVMANRKQNSCQSSINTEMDELKISLSLKVIN